MITLTPILNLLILAGDIGKANKSKQLVITDRVKELIKYKGFQVKTIKAIYVSSLVIPTPLSLLQ